MCYPNCQINNHSPVYIDTHTTDDRGKYAVTIVVCNDIIHYGT